jgi:hypothetical protein
MDGNIDTPTAIAAIVSPIKAIGALLGFAVGFIATYRAGGAISDSIMHGFLGALLVLPCAWFLALFLVREGIKANVLDQRAQYDKRLLDAKRRVALQLQATGMPLPPALEEALRAPALPPGRE